MTVTEPAQGLDTSVRTELSRTMVLIRTFEEAILREYHADKKPVFGIGAGLIPGEMHLSAGQEPVAAGVCAHLTTDDAVTATHRPHHLAIAHGVDLRTLAAEVFGRETGFGRGRDGTCTCSCQKKPSFHRERSSRGSTPESRIVAPWRPPGEPHRRWAGRS